MTAHGLWTDLARLDQRLAQAVAAADRAYGREAAGDRFRGLHIGPDDVDRLLAREAGTPTLHAPGDDGPDGNGEALGSSRLDWLADAYELSAFDRDVVLVALAPEVDLRYERLYAYLQDDVTRRRPSVDLALNLLCASKEEKLAQRSRFAADGPLLRNDLLRLITDPTQPEPPLLTHALKLDDQIVRLLLEVEGLDPRLAGLAYLCEPSHANAGLDDATLRALDGLAARHLARSEPLRVHMHGLDTHCRRMAAEVIALGTNKRLLCVDLATTSDGEMLERAFRVALREVWFDDAALYLEGCERLWDSERPHLWTRCARALAMHNGIVILGSGTPMGRRSTPAGTPPIGLLPMSIPPPAERERRTLWEAHLREAGVALSSAHVEWLADRFRLTSGEIAEAAAVVAETAESAGEAQGTAAALFAAVRNRSAWDVQGLVRRIVPRRRWDELVVPTETQAQLRELCQRALHSRRVLTDWGFGARLSLGHGTTALFAGPSGSGKTMAAEVIAGELGLDLYKVDLSGVVSKWIGETEKNLDRIFRAAEGGSGVLFFDEADALFGRRSKVHDSHDRYANVEISYLLQRMEEHDGLAILATNLRANLDDAFIRRLSFVVHFPFPDEHSRLCIWQRIWPEELPIDGLDLPGLARELQLTGGNIRNVALAAAYLAAADGGVVRMDHVRQAVRREFQKTGKIVGAGGIGAGVVS